MSKDIWHEPTETPTEHKTLLFDSIEFDETEMGVYSGGLFHSYNEFEPMTPAGLSRWAYLSDFINCQKELICTRKALDVAVDALKEIDKTRSVANHKIGTQDKTLNSGIVFCWTTPDEIHNALEQITALEQKESKMGELDDIYEKLKQLPQIKNATLLDIFNQRVKLYNEEKCSNEIILGVEFAMIWKTIDEFIKQTNDIFARITNEDKKEEK